MDEERVYLTEEIYVLDDTMYREDSDGTSGPLTPATWHHDLRAYGWGKLPRPWVSFLNSHSDARPKNSQYGVIDCGGGGDCFFHCVAHALTENTRWETTVDAMDVRQILCLSLTEEDYKDMISIYRIMADANDFDEAWDPYEVETLDDLKEVILEGGNTYWGDYQLFTRLSDALRLNIIIMIHCEGEISVYNTLKDYDMSYDTIMILYVNQVHFQLLGHFNGQRMVTYFNDANVPPEIRRGILNIDENDENDEIDENDENDEIDENDENDES